MLNTIQNPCDVYCLDYQFEGLYFAAGGKDGILRVYDEEKTELISEMKSYDRELPGHSNRVYAVKWSRTDPNLFVSGGWDNTLQIYDFRTKAPVSKIQGPYICGDGIDIFGN